MKTPDTTLHILPFESVSIPLKSVKRGDWVLLPSGNLVEVFKVIGADRPEVEVRALNEDGTPHNVPYRLSLV
jgi:hypothetical protein